jgi:hypothetical protein
LDRYELPAKGGRDPDAEDTVEAGDHLALVDALGLLQVAAHCGGAVVLDLGVQLDQGDLLVDLRGVGADPLVLADLKALGPDDVAGVGHPGGEGDSVSRDECTDQLAVGMIDLVDSDDELGWVDMEYSFGVVVVT